MPLLVVVTVSKDGYDKSQQYYQQYKKSLMGGNCVQRLQHKSYPFTSHPIHGCAVSASTADVAIALRDELPALLRVFVVAGMVTNGGVSLMLVG